MGGKGRHGLLVRFLLISFIQLFFRPGDFFGRWLLALTEVLQVTGASNFGTEVARFGQSPEHFDHIASTGPAVDEALVDVKLVGGMNRSFTKIKKTTAASVWVDLRSYPELDTRI